MRKLLPIVLLLTACAPAHYFYNFDITNPGAKNLTKMGELDVLETPEARIELMVDPANFQSILMIITNRTNEPMMVQWGRIGIIGPDRVERSIHPDDAVGRIEPYTKVRVRLIPFELPAIGPAALGYDNQAFELVVPLTVHNTEQKDLRINLLAHAVKL
jgi:hypothetical protein